MKHKYSYSGYIRETYFYKPIKKTYHYYQVEAYTKEQARFLLIQKISKDMKLKDYQIDIDDEGINDFGVTEKQTTKKSKKIVSNIVEEQLTIQF
jgi:hypothetical protein